MNLYQGLREKIVDNAMRHALERRFKALCKEHDAIRDALYKKFMGPHSRTIEKLPPDLQTQLRKDYLEVRLGGQTVNLRFCGTFKCLHGYGERFSQRKPHPWFSWSHKPELPATDPLTERYRAWENTRAQYQEDAAQLHAELTAAVKAKRTLEKLLEAWPQAKQFLPENVSPPAPVPAIRPEELNAKIEQVRKAS